MVFINFDITIDHCKNMVFEFQLIKIKVHIVKYNCFYVLVTDEKFWSLLIFIFSWKGRIVKIFYDSRIKSNKQ